MSHSQGHSGASCQRLPWQGTGGRQVHHLVRQRILDAGLDAVKQTLVHVILQDQETARLHQQGEQVPVLLCLRRGALQAADGPVEVEEGVGAQADGGDGGVVQRAVFMRHNPFSFFILVHQHMIGRFPAERTERRDFLTVRLEPVRNLLRQHSSGMW